MRAVVTGGAGFIGSHLVDLLLAKDWEVCVIDNFTTGRRENLTHVVRDIQLVEADLAQEGDWRKVCQPGDYVFHLAALADIVPSIEAPSDYFKANVVATQQLLEVYREMGVQKLVYAASSSCYGIPSVYPTPESAPIQPQYPYALTKRLGEELVLHWGQVYRLPVNSLRFFNVYGPRSRTSGTYGAMFGVFLAQKLAGKPLTIVGNGTQTRDFTYVTDVAEALFQAASSPITGEIFNVGSGVTVSVNRIAELVGGQTVSIPKRPGEPHVTFADIHKIRTQLGWTPSWSIEAGVKELLHTIDYWAEAPVWEPESIAKQTKAWFKYLS